MALWMLPVAGAVGGALLNKKKPLKGALIGAGLGAGGMLAAPYLGAAGGSYGAGAFGTAAGYGGAGAATVTPTAGAGLLGGLKTAAGYAQPVMQGMQAAQMAGGLFGGGEQQQAPQMMPQQVAENQQLQGLLQAGQQGISETEQEQMKRRLQNQQLIRQIMGGGNG